MAKVKFKADPFQAWSGPEGYRKLRVPDLVTIAQDCGTYVVSLTPVLLHHQEIILVIISVTGRVVPTVTVRSEAFHVNEKSTDPICDRTSDLPICSTAL